MKTVLRIWWTVFQNYIIRAIWYTLIIKTNRLKWARHVMWMKDNEHAGRILNTEVGGKRGPHRLKLRWTDGLMER